MSRGTTAPEAGDEASSPVDEGVTASVASPDQEIDEPVFMKESLRLGPFKTQIIECKTKPLLQKSAHVMIMPLGMCEAQPDGPWPLLPGLHILHMYTQLKMSSSKVSIVVRNMSEERGKGGMLGVSLTSSPGRVNSQNGSSPGNRSGM